MWRTWWSTVLGEIDSRHLLLGAAAADQTQHLDFAVAEPGRPGGAGRSGDMAVDGAREGPPEEMRVRDTRFTARFGRRARSARSYRAPGTDRQARDRADRSILGQGTRVVSCRP